MSAILLGLRRLRELAAAFAFVVLLAPVAFAQEAKGEAAPVPPAVAPVPPAATPVPATAAPAPGAENTPVPATTIVEEKLSDAQLEQLVAPIALHPDSLLAQILSAATYPLEVEMAARWSKANSGLKGKQLEDAMQGQNWDPSVKSLTTVPQVLQMMSDKLDWTKQLGDAYLAQPDDLTGAIQRLRVKAADNGHLKTTKEMKITRVDGPSPAVGGVAPPPRYIAIEPVEPEVIFVPVYDPLVVYGPWPWPVFSPFFWYPPGYVRVGVFGFGAPCFVGPALWARYDWRARRIGVHVPHFNAFNRTRLANVGINQNWRHNPVHRGNIAYNNASLQQRFGRPGINGNPIDGAGRQNALRGNLPTNAGLQRQGLTGNINQHNGVPRANLNANANPALRQNAIGNHAAVNPAPNRGPAVNRNGVVNPGAMVNRGVPAHPNVNVHRNMNVQRNVGMPRVMGGNVGMPRGMGGGMPAARPMMGNPGAARAVAAPAGRSAAGGGIRR